MRAAFYESDITPPLGGYLTGHGDDRRAQDVYTRLHSKALVLENGGVCAAIISVDICEYPEEMHDLVTARIFEYTGIPPENVCITSTHAHTGAPVTDNPNINCFGDSTYKDVFFRLVADSAILAYKRLKESTLRFGIVRAEGIAVCRCSHLKDGTLATFVGDAERIERPLSEPDHELPVLFVEQEGRTVGAFYTFGCHQDTVGRKPYGYSGDYSAIVADILKDKYGRDFVSLYVPAPSGDINHLDPYKKERISCEEIGAILADGVVRAEAETVGIEGALSVTKEPIRIKRRKYTPEEYRELLRKNENDWFRLSNLVYYQQADKAEYSDLYVQVIAVGELAIYIYPGELFSEYAVRTKKHSPFKYNMVVENSNAYGGYIPIPEAFAENSNLYEISPAYDSNLVPEAGEMLYEKMMSVADGMYKKEK